MEQTDDFNARVAKGAKGAQAPDGKWGGQPGNQHVGENYE